MMSGEESLDAKSTESERDHGASSLLSQALAPVFRKQMNSHKDHWTDRTADLVPIEHLWLHVGINCNALNCVWGRVMPSARLLRSEIARETQRGKANKQDMTTHCVKPQTRFFKTLSADIGRVEPDKAPTGQGYRLSCILLFRRCKLSRGASFNVLDYNRHGLPVSGHCH